jgi:peroxiredoxin/uncharacterized membrane protein YphA (DoxX/SURF4 family)
VLLIVRLVLAAVFLLASLTKLVDLAGTRRAIVGFGLPERAGLPLAFLLPIAELAVAVALVPSRSAWWGALGAVILLLAFIAGISVNLARGRRPDCHCFGQLHSEPVGASTLIRNGVLIVGALFVAIAGHANSGPSAVSWLGNLTGAEQIGLAIVVALTILLVGQWWFLANLLAQNGRLLGEVELIESVLNSRGITVAPPPPPPSGLLVGAPAPEFALPDLSGDTVSLTALRETGKSLLLVFTDPKCEACEQLVPELAQIGEERRQDLTVAVIGRGKARDNKKFSLLDPIPVLLQRDNEVAEAFNVQGTPSAVLIRPDGLIGSKTAAGTEEIQELLHPQPQPAVRGTVFPLLQELPAVPANGQPARPARLGDPAPEIILPDLDGRQVALAEYRGKPTLLLFWSMTCGYCQRLLPQLKEWEADQPAGAPRLVVVSRGTPDENAVMNLRSPVLLDQEFATAGRFGVNGTPSAVMIDAEGHVASGVAVGAADVLMLAGDQLRAREAAAV